MKLNKFVYNYFLILFSLIPFSIIIGSSISLINILLIDTSFIFLIIYLRNFSFLKTDAFKYLIILYIYLIFNSFISIDFNLGVYRNLGFLRIILLFLAINFFFNQEKFFSKVLSVWLTILIVISLDVVLEKYTGQNILGHKSVHDRIVSFFKDELVVGGFINCFYLLIIGYCFARYEGKKKYIFLISILLFYIILITGERTNLIKALVGIITFYILADIFKKKQKIIISISIIFLTIFFIAKFDNFLKYRFYEQIKTFDKERNIGSIKVYTELYKTGFKIFKENKLFGVGNKNFRLVSCSRMLNYDPENVNYLVCNTHPHQVYFEFLSEHGLIGTVIILFIIYKLIFSKIRFVELNKNYIQLGCFIYISLIFLPLIPSGSFFTDRSLIFFTINLALFYASNKKLNVFNTNIKS